MTWPLGLFAGQILADDVAGTSGRGLL